MRDHRPPAEQVAHAVVRWAKARQDVRGVALVGSSARGTARPDSDIDIVILAAAPAVFRADLSWLGSIDWPAAGTRVGSWRDEDYGAVWSRHVRLDTQLEVEITFAPLTWANLAPLDSGTRAVIAAGCRVLHDPDGLLGRLCKAVNC